MCDRPHTVKVICADANPGILNQSVAELFRRQACTFDIEEDHIGFLDAGQIVARVLIKLHAARDESGAIEAQARCQGRTAGQSP